MKDELRAVFDELQATIERSDADGVIDDGERTELRAILGRLDSLLADPDGVDDDDHDGVVEQLEESAIRFEGRHPTVAAVIRSTVDTLTGYGM